MNGAVEHTDRMKVFVSYSRDDVAFADQLVAGLETLGVDPILDRHDIDAAENWKERLGGLILSSDTVAFVLTDKSAGSPICGWEVDEAKRLGKRIVPVVPREVSQAPPQALADLNWIHFYSTAAIPGSGMFDGLRKLERALKMDLAWLREQTRLSERAAEWTQSRAEDRLLRGATLKEAQDWLGRAPKDANVPASVRDYLSVSGDAEQNRDAAARAQVAEREQALRTAEAAVKERSRAVSRLRWVSVSALLAGVALVAAALVGGSIAASNYVDALESKATLVAVRATELSNGGDRAKAMLAILSADPAAHNGPIQSFLRPNGYPAVRSALAEMSAKNRLVRTISAHDEAVTSLAFSPDGQTLLTGSWDMTAKLWDVATGTLRGTLKGHDDAIVAVAFSPNGRFALTASIDGTAKVWSVADTGSIGIFYGQDRASAAAFFPDGERVVIGSADGTARIWSVQTYRLLTELDAAEGGDVTATAVSPDAKTVLIGSANGEVSLWSADGKKLTEFTAHSGGVTSAAFAFDGSGILTGSDEGTAKVWRLEDRKPIRILVGHESSVTAAAFFGNEILTASLDGTARLISERDTVTLGGHLGGILAAQFAPNGRLIATAGEDGQVKLWGVEQDDAPADPIGLSADQQIQQACMKLKEIGVTQFTETDRERYSMLVGLSDTPCGHW